MIKKQTPLYSTGMAELPIAGLAEVAHPVLDANGMPIMDTEWTFETDANGQPIMVNKWLGDIALDVLTPWEYRREPGSDGMHKSKYLQQIRLMDFDDYLREYKNEKGATHHFRTVTPKYVDSEMLGFALRHFLRLHFTTPPTLQDGDRKFDKIIRGNLFRHKVLVIEHYDRPNEDMWPTGRKLVIANGKCTHISIPEYQTQGLDGWHPFVESQWLTLKPSIQALGPMNDIIDKNRELNVADSLISTAMQRNMGSHLILRTGSGIDKNQFTGTPGEIFETTMNPSEVASYLHDNQPIPPAVPNVRNQHKDDVYELSGAQEALRGERSKGVSSGYQLRQLTEREEARLSHARSEFAQAIARIGVKAIACMKARTVELDADTFAYMQKNSRGTFTSADVIAFVSQPLEAGIDITIEPEALRSQSKATKDADTIELLTKVGGFTNRASTDAGVLDAVAKQFQVESLRDASSCQRDCAEKENEVFGDIMRVGYDKAGLAIPTVIFEDDDTIHLAAHDIWLVQNKEQMLNDPMTLQGFLFHKELHRTQQKEKLGEVPVGSTADFAQNYKVTQAAGTKPAQQVAAEHQQLVANRQNQQPPPQAAQPQQANTPAPKTQGGQAAASKQQAAQANPASAGAPGTAQGGQAV
jgi:hypothetical protein